MTAARALARPEVDLDRLEDESEGGEDTRDHLHGIDHGAVVQTVIGEDAVLARREVRRQAEAIGAAPGLARLPLGDGKPGCRQRD